MYCPKCGNIVNTKLNYCNSCGAKIANQENQEGKISPLNGLITTLTFIAIFGLVMLVGLLAILLDKVTNTEFIVMICFAYLATLFGICFFILKQISKLIDAKIVETHQPATPIYQNVQIDSPITAQLEELKQQPISVTEQTTKTLDEVLLKRK